MSKKYVQVLGLKNDPKLIEFYIDAHKTTNIWPEIVEGIRKVGILNMEIYLKDANLVMIIEASDDFDFQSAMKKLAFMDRQQEWEEYVGRAQACEENSTSAGKWKMTEKIFSLLECLPQR